MASLILRVISQRWAAGYSLRCIPPTGEAAGIFSSARFSNCYGRKLDGRMMSTMRSVNSSDESSSSTLPSRTSPWLMLPPAFGGGDMIYNFFSLAQNKVVRFEKRGEEKSDELPDDDTELVGSSHGWLALFNERNCYLFLSNPLSHRHIKLPPIHTLPIPEVNLKGGFGCVKKVIISSSPDEEECRAMMCFGPEDRLAFCCPGHSTEWTPLGALFHEDDDRKVARVYEDFVYSNRQKLFFCITQYGEMEGWDLRDPRSPRIDWTDNDELEFDEENYPWAARSEQESELKKQCRQPKYLVFSEESNQLFLVTRHIVDRMGPDGCYVKSIYYGMHKGWDDSYPYKTIGFDVHRIDREDGRVRYMEGSLDGLAMFIGLNHSFAVSAPQFPESKPNSIYFTDDHTMTPPKWDVDSTYGGHDIGIFDYETRTLSPCYYPSHVQSIKRIMPPPMWFTPTQYNS